MQPPRILYVEDDPNDYALLKDSLEGKGIAVDLVHATTAEEFLNVVQCEEPALILADSNVPGFDTGDALALARECVPGVPFFCLSGYMTDARMDAFRAAGANGYLNKDDTDNVTQVIRRVIDARFPSPLDTSGKFTFPPPSINDEIPGSPAWVQDRRLFEWRRAQGNPAPLWAKQESKPATVSDRPVILLAEDERDAEVMTRLAIERAGFGAAIEVARNGREVLERILGPGRARPALLLLQTRLPGIDGFEVLAKLRANAATRSLPIVMLSVQDDPRDVTRSYDLGANSYLLKRADLSDFCADMKACLQFWFRTALLPRNPGAAPAGPPSGPAAPPTAGLGSSLGSTLLAAAKRPKTAR